MRSDLSALLDELEPMPQPDGLHGPMPAKRLAIAARSERWTLAIKLGRELGAAIDPQPLEGGPSAPAPRKPRKVDYG